MTPLHFAAKNGHCSIAEFLITSGADVNVVDNVSCLVVFLFTTVHHDDVQELWTPLHYAVFNDYCSVIEYLVTSGANVNAVNIVSCLFTCVCLFNTQ